jgi:hypothetical protein
MYIIEQFGSAFGTIVVSEGGVSQMTAPVKVRIARNVLMVDEKLQGGDSERSRSTG